MSGKFRAKAEKTKGAKRGRRPGQRLEQILEQLASGAGRCAKVQKLLGRVEGPAIESLLKLFRTLVLKCSLEPEAAPELVKMAIALLKPVLDWARLEERRQERELAEQKYHDQREDLRATRQREANGNGGLSPETLEQIERELNLF